MNDFDALLLQAHFDILWTHLLKRPHQLKALAKLYFGGTYHITPWSLWDALHRRGLVKGVDDKQPMLDSLSEDGLLFCKWYDQRKQKDATRADPFKARHFDNGYVQPSLFEDSADE